MPSVEVKRSPPGVPGAVGDPTRIVGEELTYPGAAGAEINGYLARPADASSHAGVVVIHEAGGLGDHIRDVCNRFANIGYVALGVDLFTREGGPPDTSDTQGMMQRLFSMSDELALGDLEGAADYLRGLDGSPASLLLVVGRGMWEDTTGALEHTLRFAASLRARGIRHELDEVVEGEVALDKPRECVS